MKAIQINSLSSWLQGSNYSMIFKEDICWLKGYFTKSIKSFDEGF